MIGLFINAVAASAGGGITYIRNVLPWLAERDDAHTTVLLEEHLCHDIAELPNLSMIPTSLPAGAAPRFFFEQRNLPGLIRRAKADVLLSTGNFALFRSPVPQILLSRNALYTSSDFTRDLRRRGDYRLWIDTEIKGVLAKCSVRAAECTVAPSAAFAHDLADWTGKKVSTIHHGFDHKAFFCDQTPLPVDVQAQLTAARDSLRILFVSHFNYYRNFETLIRAIAILKKKLRPRTVRLFLTCKLDARENPGSYRPEGAADLLRQLDLSQEVIQLGAVPYGLLHHLYRACHLYVAPAYAETFAHPLVEAMASGLPVIASNLPVHREICRDAALYFDRFSPEELAERVVQVFSSPERAAKMRENALSRSCHFSWNNHVEQLLELAQRLHRR